MSCITCHWGSKVGKVCSSLLASWIQKLSYKDGDIFDSLSTCGRLQLSSYIVHSSDQGTRQGGGTQAYMGELYSDIHVMGILYTRKVIIIMG